MDSVLRAFAVYFFLLVVFRIAGKRALSEITTFDFVLLLVVAETTQQALLGDDFSIVNSFVLIATLLALDFLLSSIKQRSPRLDRAAESQPRLVVDHGRALEEPMRDAHLDVDDVLEAARRLRGLERLDQVKYAVLERSGGISIVPYDVGDRG